MEINAPKMRRKDRAMTQEEAMALLEKGAYGVLASCSETTGAYAVPLSYIVMNNGIYFHCARTGHKIENIAREPRVSFCVVGKTQPVFGTDFTTLFESAIAFGPAAEVEDDEEKRDALRRLCEKYLPEHMDRFDEAMERSYKVTRVMRIDICQLTGKAKRQP